MRFRAASVRLCGLVVLAVCLVSCGKKTRPVPPDTVLPAPIRDLRYQLDEKGVVLSWSYPQRTVQGARLPYAIKGFELLRAVVPEKDYCEGCPVNFGPPIAIDVDTVSLRGARSVSYAETLLRPQHRYIYRVRSRAGWYQVSEPSNTVSFVWDTPLAAPQELELTPGDRTVTIRWQAPRTRLDGTPVTGAMEYQVWRSVDGETFSAVDRNVNGTTFTDKDLENGRRYYYRVRAVRVHKDTRAAGMASGISSAVPVDRVAPPPPRQVTVVQTPAGVNIYWEAVDAPDLAGYRIYRRPATSGTPTLLGEVGPATLSYTDRSSLQGAHRWLYAVSAIDREEPANESALSKEAELDILQ